MARKWLEEVIDDLGLASLESFPTGELSEGLPALVRFLADCMEEPHLEASARSEIRDATAAIASLRKENPSIRRLIEDFATLRKFLLEAAATRLRRSDRNILEVVANLDAGFNLALSRGVESYFERHSSRLEQLAHTDPLTGLYNVRYFRMQLHNQLELYKRYRIPFSLLMIDLDELKQLNDARGHGAGDRALRHLADILQSQKRETDIAVRYGGDEFFLILPGTTTGEGERLAYRISRKAKEMNLRTGGREMTGVSIGVVSCPQNGMDVSTLRARADNAMYLAKKLGGGTVARFRALQD